MKGLKNGLILVLFNFDSARGGAEGEQEQGQPLPPPPFQEQEGVLPPLQHTADQIREFSLKYGTLGPICKKEEPAELPTNVTRRVLLSSSTLFNIWEDSNLFVDHLEMEAVLDGRVRDLTRVLDRMYL